MKSRLLRRRFAFRTTVGMGAIAALAGCGPPAQHRLVTAAQALPKARQLAVGRGTAATVSARATLEPGYEPAILERVAQYGPAARARLAPYFATAGVAYPPDRFVLLAFKRERKLHLLASTAEGRATFIRSYPIRGASGVLGPKLREGDRQVPEGIYEIEYLNPRSVAHLSLALSYPNDFDRAHAAEDGRDTLGGEIMIHGGAGSSGCLAIGNQAAEELFVLAVDAGWEDALVVVSPVDFRKSVLSGRDAEALPWVDNLYTSLILAVEKFPSEPVRIATRAPGAAD